MKILVTSDSHGNSAALAHAIECEAPDALIHLGDGWRDVARNLDIPCWRVLGNCDDPACGFPEKRVAEIDGVRIFLTHGHIYSVKDTLIHLRMTALEANARLALFGHTHIPFFDSDPDGVSLFNPGSLRSGSYGILQTDGKSFSLRHASADVF